MSPCRNCVFNTHAEGCPTDGGAPCTFTNKWRKFIPKDITNPTYNYNYVLPEVSEYMAVYDFEGETWMHTVTDKESLDYLLGRNTNEVITYFDRAGNVVARLLPITGHIEENT